MKRNIKVERLNQRPLEQQEIELVERKGIGHPDSVADGLAESISRALCQEYLDRFGAVLHHNTDKTQIVAGRSKPAFGGGEVICPLYILLTGRATRVFKEEEIPVDTIAIKAARKLLSESLSNLDVNNHVILDAKIEGLRGGTGRRIDPALLVDWKRPYLLAGGLTPENVEEAVRRIRPFGVDVASGVERAPGVKDREKVLAFVRNARAGLARMPGA